MSKRAMVRAAARRRRAGTALAVSVLAGAAASSASAIEVNSLADPGNGNCNDGTCTLREAISLANSTPSTADTITFKQGLAGTINLNGSTGQLEPSSPMSLQGPGSGVVTISGDSNSDGTPDTRVMYIDADGVAVSGLTLTKGAGKANSSDTVFRGGALYLFASTTSLSDVVVSASTAGRGGGIWSGDSNLTISDSSLVGNEAPSRGGGIAAEKIAGSHSRSLRIEDSLIAGNKSDYGGGVFASDNSSLEVERSTISGNSAGTYGSGGHTNNTPVSIVDSTIAGNEAVGGAGGVGWSFGSGSGGSRIVSSTIAANTKGYAGGILASSGTTGPITISSSIVADNSDTDLQMVGTSPVFTVSGALIETPDQGSFTEAPGSANIIGTDPQLGPLADNGGPTPTMLPAATSPVVDAGNANALATDQRGLTRTVDQVGVGAATSDGTDIGAVELADSTAPDLSAAKKGKAKAGKALKIVVSSDEAAAVEIDATAKAGKKRVSFEGASGSVPAGGSVTLKLKLAKRPAKLLKRAGKGKAQVTVTATDASGNESTDPLKVKLK